MQHARRNRVRTQNADEFLRRVVNASFNVSPNLTTICAKMSLDGGKRVKAELVSLENTLRQAIYGSKDVNVCRDECALVAMPNH